MPEHVLALGCKRDLIDEFTRRQLGYVNVADQASQRFRVELRTDHRRRVQRALGGGTQAIDAGGDRRFQRRGYRHVGGVALTRIVAWVAVQDLPFGEIPDDLFGEEGIAAGPLCNLRDECTHRSIRTQQLCGQRSRVRITQRCKRNAVRTWQQAERPAVLGPIRDEHQRTRVRYHRGELGNHRLADLIDPVRVFDDVNRRCGSGDRCGVEERREATPACVGINGRQRGFAVTNAEQVVEQNEVFSIGSLHDGTDVGPRGLVLEAAYREDVTQQACGRVERDLGGVRFAVRRENLNGPASGDRSDLPCHAALANSGRPNQPDNAAPTVHRLVEHRPDGAQLPLTANKGRHLTGPPPTLAGDCQQAAGSHRRLHTLDRDAFRFTEHDRFTHQSCGGFTEHHSAGRRDRLHALRQADLLTDCGLTQRPRAHFTGDDLAGIQPDSQLQRHSVALLHLAAQPIDLFVDVQCGHAGA